MGMEIGLHFVNGLNFGVLRVKDEIHHILSDEEDNVAVVLFSGVYINFACLSLLIGERQAFEVERDGTS
jgi:hypothetical protein